jgi:dienelactone hydrolase
MFFLLQTSRAARVARTSFRFTFAMLILAAALPTVVLAEEPAATPAATETKADRGLEIDLRENVQYGTGAGEPLTLHLAKLKNAEGRRPVIAYIHGGGWRAGSKDGHKLDAIEAAKRGYVAVSIGYRFAPAHLFPAQIEDVKCAIRWLRANADELGIDPERIGAIGYSAGAHLSMMLGTMDSSDGFEGSGGSPDQSSKVQAVVAYFGPTNFEATYPAITVPIVEGFLGGSREQKPDAYKQRRRCPHADLPGDQRHSRSLRAGLRNGHRADQGRRAGARRIAARPRTRLEARRDGPHASRCDGLLRSVPQGARRSEVVSSCDIFTRVVRCSSSPPSRCAS